MIRLKQWMAMALTMALSLTGGIAMDKPNIVLVMADDLGYGDVGYTGNPVQKTPHLDAMSREGIRFDRFYAAAPVCSPTRGSCLTGRHPHRYNIPWAGEYPLPREEITLAKAVKTAGYATGHFGKWHVGGLSKTVKQSYFAGPVDPQTYSPPWDHGFDVCFSTESMVPTYNPYYHVGGDFGTEDYRFIADGPVEKGQRTGGFTWRDRYWTGPGKMIDEWLEGDDSEIIMDRALRFITRCARAEKPFLSLVWFHTPHTPVVAGNDDRAPYAEHPMEAQHWHGSIAAMDAQVGRLRAELRSLGIADNTIVWFCSDNGPSYIHDWNSSAGLRGKKATLWEGGIRVPAVLEWPAKLKAARVVTSPVSTSDFYPTLLKALGVEMPNQPVLDGIDVMPLIQGHVATRPSAIPFQAPVKSTKDVLAVPGSKQLCLIEDQYKLISVSGGETWFLYDLTKDQKEEHDVASENPDIVARMRAELEPWVDSCAKSAAGADYE